VAAVTFDSLEMMLLAPGIYLAITSLEGSFITPLILGQRLTLNPVVIFVSLITWGWLWGIVGTLIAVPMLVCLKILCDHIEPLQPLGEFLGW
ncbi:MAG TPA: AI-2E family transporter, partial [Acidobacteriota bacterium]|nr:AI-2E family transporter [Acidobacteriota bacterium]